MADNNTRISSSIIAESGIAFGTSGARGLVTQFTAEVCTAFTQSFVNTMQKSFQFKQIAIAIDNRPSSYAMAQACAASLQQENIDVIYYGVLPTPALAFAAQQKSIPAIMVTGSHIPFDRNGLKFYRPDGEISKLDEQAILSAQVDVSASLTLAELDIAPQAANNYIKRYTSLFDTPWLTGKRIGIYEHSSSGRDLYPHIFNALGAEVISLGRSEEFVPIDTEAVAEQDINRAIHWSRLYQLDAIFSTDGDGDRPLIADEKGQWLRGDILGLLCASELNIEALAVPVSCNTSIELCQRFKHVRRTKIGSPFVIAEFDKLAEKYNSVAGFEANGGFLLGSDIQLKGKDLFALPTRDAVLPAIMLLLASRHVNISSLLESLPKFFTYSDRLQNFAIEKSLEIIKQAKLAPQAFLSRIGFSETPVMAIDETDGLRLILNDERIIHLRPSGNAPELRCYAQANTEQEAKRCVLGTLTALQQMAK